MEGNPVFIHERNRVRILSGTLIRQNCIHFQFTNAVQVNLSSVLFSWPKIVWIAPIGTLQLPFSDAPVCLRVQKRKYLTPAFLQSVFINFLRSW